CALNVKKKKRRALAGEDAHDLIGLPFNLSVGRGQTDDRNAHIFRRLFDRQKCLEALLLRAILQGTSDYGGVHGAADERGKTSIRAAGDGLKNDVSIRIQAVAAEQLIDRKISRAAESINGDSFAFEGF